MIVFKSAGKVFTINEDVKNFSYEQLEDVFTGVLDYKQLARELGIKKSRPIKSKQPKEDK